MSEYIVFTPKEHYNTLGIIRTLGEAGIRPITVFVKSQPKFAAQSKYVKERYYVDSTEEAIELILEKWGKNKEDKSYILTGDDVAVAAMDQNYDRLKDYFYFYNAGQQGKISYWMNKDNMISVARKHGINVAKTWKVRVGEIPEDIAYPIMTKALNSIGSEWKNIVFICHNDQELRDAYSKIKSEYILLQTYVDKVDEVSYDGFSINGGKDLIILTQVYQEYCIPDKYSPYWIVKNSTDRETTDKIRKVIAEIGLEGIFEFEFMIDKDGKLWFLEINFRNTALGYSTTSVGMPQVTLWCDAMKKGALPQNYYREIPEGTHAMAECFDYDVRVRGGVISRKEWMKQYRACICKLYKGHDDIVPFLRFLWYKYTVMRRGK